jgi:hypothetical protein
MLVAFSFPEDDYKNLYNIASGLLKKNNIAYEAQWPHVSILGTNNINDEDKLEIKTALKNKPEFKPLGWGILNGQSKDFLVILLDKPKEYMDAYEFIKEKFNITPYLPPKPHVSFLSFNKNEKEQVANLLPLISQKTDGIIPSTMKSAYIQFWNKVDPTEGADVTVRGKNFKDIEDKEYQIADVTESKKKKKKRKTALAAFYGKGDGRSGATMPPFRAPTNGPTPRLGASLPSPVTGINAPQFGTMPAAPMVAWRDEIATLFESNFHVCLVCNGNRVMKNNVACPLCSQIDSSVQVSPLETCVNGGGVDNTNNFMGFDVPWDLR